MRGPHSIRGTLCNISSSGIYFETAEEWPVGTEVELAIDWPGTERVEHSMQLVIQGYVVRSGGSHAAVAISRHEIQRRQFAGGAGHSV